MQLYIYRSQFICIIECSWLVYGGISRGFKWDGLRWEVGGSWMPCVALTSGYPLDFWVSSDIYGIVL